MQLGTIVIFQYYKGTIDNFPKKNKKKKEKDDGTWSHYFAAKLEKGEGVASFTLWREMKARVVARPGVF